MTDDEVGVAVARWESQATPLAIETVRRDVAAFAARHGMRKRDRAPVALAVAEAVADAVVRARPAAVSTRLTVHAATDGEWLTVRVDDDAPPPHQDAALALPLVAAVCDRLEYGRSRDGGNRLLMELALTGGRRPRVRRGATPQRQPGRPARCQAT